MSDSFPKKYRPSSFEQVWGQEVSVRVVSELVRRGGICRHLLFHGAAGSGKTSVARLYGRALNCRQVLSGGSPCNACDRCESDENFFEYDVAGAGGAKDQVKAWTEQRLGR